MTVQNCNEYCMNWDEKRYCCSLGHRSFKSKKNPNSYFAPNCADYVDIDSYMESDRNMENDEQSWIETENRKPQRRPDFSRNTNVKAPKYYDEAELRSQPGLMNEQHTPLSDEDFIENLVHENHMMSKLITEFVDSENVKLDEIEEQRKENDLSEFVDESIEVEEGYTEMMDDIPTDIQQSSLTNNISQNRSNQTKAVSSGFEKQNEINNFNSVDDFVDESIGIIDSYGDDLTVAKLAHDSTPGIEQANTPENNIEVNEKEEQTKE